MRVLWQFQPIKESHFIYAMQRTQLDLAPEFTNFFVIVSILFVCMVYSFLTTHWNLNDHCELKHACKIQTIVVIIVAISFYNCCVQLLYLLSPIVRINCCLQLFGSQSIYAGIVRKSYFNNEFCYLLYSNACYHTFCIKRVPCRFLNSDTHDFHIICKVELWRSCM